MIPESPTIWWLSCNKLLQSQQFFFFLPTKGRLGAPWRWVIGFWVTGPDRHTPETNTGTIQGTASFFMKLARASSRPLWIREFIVSSSMVIAAYAFFAPARISAFIWVYLWASSAIRWNSASEIVPSASAFETWSAIVFNLLTARTLTSSCFLALTKRRWLMNLPATPRSPQPNAATSSPRTTGVATMVDNRPTPSMPIPILAEISVVSTASTALTPRRYFLYSWERLSLSSSRCWLNCEISWSRKYWSHGVLSLSAGPAEGRTG